MSFTGKCITNCDNIFTMEHCSKIKRNELSSPRKTWVNIKGILLSEIESER